MFKENETCLSHELAQAILNYLAGKPYAETFQMIHGLQSANAETKQRREAFEAMSASQVARIKDLEARQAPEVPVKIEPKLVEGG